MSLNSKTMEHFLAGCSDRGQQRKLNEDSFYIDESLGLILVADGMGGHNAGDVASSNAVKLIHQYISERQKVYHDHVAQSLLDDDSDSEQTMQYLPNPLLELVEQSVQYANTELYGMNKRNGFADNQGMGTTVVGAWMQSRLGEAIIFHVGDSRAYIHRSEQISQLTKDHSLYQQWLDFGRIGPEPPQNIILHAIGLTPKANIDIRIQNLQSGDVILLCSDGLTNMVSDLAINKCLSQVTIESIESLCQSLVKQANDRGGTDNITVVMGQYS